MVIVLLEVFSVSSERQKLISALRVEGNFKYNMENSSGHVLSARKLHNEREMKKDNYVPCPHCKVFVIVGALRRHYRSCDSNRQFNRERNVLIKSRALVCNIHIKANDTLKYNVFPVMKDDAVTNIIRYDRLLIIYGNTLCQKYRDPHHFDMIRSRLRLMGRFLINLKSKTNAVTDFHSLYYSKNVDCISFK